MGGKLHERCGGGDQAAGHCVVVGGFALEAVHDGAVCCAHVVVGLFAVGRWQPALFLGCKDVEGFEHIGVGELNVTGALLVERGGEVVQLDFCGLAAGLGSFEGGAEIVAVVGGAVGVEEVKRFLDVGDLLRDVGWVKIVGVDAVGVAAENDALIDLVAEFVHQPL